MTRPHLFNGSWMRDASGSEGSERRLGQVLKHGRSPGFHPSAAPGSEADFLHFSEDKMIENAQKVTDP